ncbi:hypothetical protein AM500_02795 [Bacillus sp. FJAT-18017]|uniref:DUF4870 domain-containing protein n=1 Tax=unclassified Bacillus (in: firmicutes) TaxID=185979 RepID=UPI0005C4D197|nr:MULTISPECIES: DUF4870 domain-containing protein [unclassified Bacillus (in: firmicutes)]ALC88843.1 hypothetical protein AM500_02795 [Bacillus sp. FJAT-18017]
MDTQRVLSALCYFSVFFAAFLLPCVVYFVADSEVTKSHAKKAFLSHLIPIAGVPFIIMLALFVAAAEPGAGFVFAILGFIVYGILVLGITIWNVIMGIKALQEPAHTYHL